MPYMALNSMYRVYTDERILCEHEQDLILSSRGFNKFSLQWVELHMLVYKSVYTFYLFQTKKSLPKSQFSAWVKNTLFYLLIKILQMYIFIYQNKHNYTDYLHS